jgi:hypothetical protein
VSERTKKRMRKMRCIERSRVRQGLRDPQKQSGLTRGGLILQTRYVLNEIIKQ